METNLGDEARAFDEQIEDRIRHGHIPDLRRCKPCDWFYNNPWRHPEYVKLDFGEQFELIQVALRAHCGKQQNGHVKVLEIGCGPGYLALELARAGFDVTGIDLSEASIAVARRFSDEDPWKESRAPLAYVAGDFYAEKTLKAGSYDAVVFLGALHHFPDQHKTLRRCRELLKTDGIIVAHEPCRDRVTRGNAAFSVLLQVVLSAGAGFFKQMPIPSGPADMEKMIEALYHQLRYETDEGVNVQSVNDNEAGFAEMSEALRANFKTEEMVDRYAFFHEVIGGLRFDAETNFRLARFLRDMDKRLVQLGVLQATEFFFVGRNTAQR